MPTGNVHSFELLVPFYLGLAYALLVEVNTFPKLIKSDVLEIALLNI